MRTVSEKTKYTFYLVFLMGAILTLLSFYFLYFLFSRMHLVWLSVLGKLETICGCANHFVFSNHPYLFSFLILSFFIISAFLLSIIYKAIKLRRTTNIFIRNTMGHKLEKPSDKIRTISKEIKLEKDVSEIEKSELNVFCYGILKPKVCISSRFVKSLSLDELRAVLLHEQHHVISRDPLKFYIVKIFSSVFFFVPFFNILSQKFFTLSEMAADAWVVERMKEKKSLASAVFKILKQGEKSIYKQGLIVPLFGSVTEERVNNIVDDKYVFDIKLLTKRLVMFLGVFIFSFSVYTFMILTGDNVIAMHSDNLCYEQGNNDSLCTMDSGDGLCEMEEEDSIVEEFTCEEK